jgi:hypothetical protein
VRTVRHFLVLIASLAVGSAWAQTTITSGTWADPTVWNTGVVPTATSTVTVSHPLTIDANISISSGSYSFNASSTDFSGAPSYTLTMSGGTLTVGNGSNTPTVTFEGAATFANATILVRTGATLILGPTTFNNGNTVTVESGATIIVNGTLLNSNSSGTITIGGLIYVNGDYDTNNGNLLVSGAGDLIATGTISNQGSSTTFGSNADCGTGPCSGQNLCTGANTVTPLSQFICSGGAISMLDGNAMSDVNYQWQSSTTSATATDFTNIAGATGENYTPSPVPSVTTWYRRVATNTSDATCVGRSIASQITVSASGSWSGNVSTDWNNTGNWCGGAIPTSTTDVVISSTATRQPTISAANAVCRNLTVASGAVITITDRTLNITGNLTYNGSFVYNGSTTGAITFTGTSAQTISGSTPYIFNNVTFNNTSGATPAIAFSGNAITVNQGLTLTAGTINLGGYNVTIGTSAASPGSLTYTSGRFYNGNITRWFGTGAVTVETVGGYFPIGSSTDNRPFYLGFTGLTTGGTVRVQHTAALGSTASSFNDSNPTAAVQVVSNSYWTVSRANGLAFTGSPFSATAGGTTFGTVSDAVNHLRLTQQNAAIGGNAGANGASTTDLRIRRTAFAFPSNPFNVYIASTNSTLSSLPITLSHFSARPVVEGVRLQWTTAMEENFSHFSIERSRDGKNFEAIDETPARGGKNLVTHYAFVDGSAKSGRFYYRLKSIDIDNAFEYSAIERVDIEKASFDIASIYPNPVAGKFTVSVFEGKNGKMNIIDKYGRSVAEAELREGNQDFEFNSLPSGIYYARIQTENGLQTIKVVLNNN